MPFELFSYINPDLTQHCAMFYICASFRAFEAVQLRSTFIWDIVFCQSVMVYSIPDEKGHFIHMVTFFNIEVYD
jgi:hypothetical protein